MESLDYLKEQVSSKEENISFNSMLKKYLNNINQSIYNYAVDEDEGKLSSSFLDDLILGAIPIGRIRGINKLDIGKRLSRRMGFGDPKQWLKEFGEEGSYNLLTTFRGKGSFFDIINKFKAGKIPKDSQNYNLFKKYSDFYDKNY